MTDPLFGVDLFAGAGGTSTGLIQAVAELGRRLDLIAINHWKKAIETHRANYPWATHLQTDVETVNPVEVVPGGHLDILVASPECIYYSRAAGGRPKNEQKRATAWSIFKWLELLNVDSVLVENVPEFVNWSPLDKHRKPIKIRKGEIFRAWLRTFRAHGYTVEYKVLNAADFGAPTSRSRLFVVAKRGKARPTFPTPTHCKKGWPKKKWRSAREIIDWSIQGQSIFGRKRPLSENTIRRIVEGLKKFGGKELRPFIILMEHGGAVRDIDSPLPTITTAKGGAIAVAEPCAKDGKAFIVPNFGERGNQTPRTHSVKEPLPTVTSHGAGNLVQAFLPPVEGFYRENQPRSLDDPLNTITGRGAGHLVEPFIVEYYGNGGAESVGKPLHTIPTKDRFGLVQPVINDRVLDIKFRMLQPKELARATGFPENYQFIGNKTEVVKQIGNAVVVNMAKALCLSLLQKKKVKP